MVREAEEGAAARGVLEGAVVRGEIEEAATGAQVGGVGRAAAKEAAVTWVEEA